MVQNDVDVAVHFIVELDIRRATAVELEPYPDALRSKRRLDPAVQRLVEDVDEAALGLGVLAEGPERFGLVLASGSRSLALVVEEKGPKLRPLRVFRQREEEVLA